MSTQTAELPRALARTAERFAVVRDWLLAVKPLYVVSTLVVIQWAAVAALAVTVRHNGWIYYMGGDQLWHYSQAYLLVHGKLAPTLVGYGWSVLLAPIALIAGRDLVSALPAIVLLNVLVLLPVALACIYGIGARLGGRIFGYWAALLWVVLPFAGIPYALHGYHEKYTELTLPQILGLGAMADLPSVVALLVGAYLCLRALDESRWIWSALAGFAVGYSLAIKPSNAAFLFAPAALFLIFRYRALIAFAAGLAPPLLTLAFWKFRGYGNLPAFAHAQAERRVALGISSPIHKYTHDNSWTQLQNNLLQLKEFLWSDRLLEFAVLAGIAALLLRTRRGAVFVGVWFTAFLLLKGTYFGSSIQDSTFWRLLLPAFPAFVLLVAALVLLVPGIRLRPPAPRPLRVSGRIRLAGAVAAGAVFVLWPLALIAAATPVRQPNLAAIQYGGGLVPITDRLRITATEQSGSVALRWPVAHPHFGRVLYRVLRTGATASTGDEACRSVKHAPDSCIIQPSAQTVTTDKGSWVDRPGPGLWTYRIGEVANWLHDPMLGDVYVFGPAVKISVPQRG